MQDQIKITRISTTDLSTKVADNLVVPENKCPITSQTIHQKICENVTSGGIKFLVVVFQTMLEHNNYHNHGFVIEMLSQSCFEVNLTTTSKQESINVAQTIADEIVKNL